MDIRMLGPVEVWAGGRIVALGPPRQRCLLAVLAADAGRPIMLDTVVDRLWGEAPPSRARHALYVHVTRLRQRLAGATGVPGHVVLVRRSGGYLLDIEPAQVDIHRFHRLVAEARDQRLDNAGRARLLRQALDLRRGTPLADLSGGWVERTRIAWCQQVLSTTMTWTRAELGAGRPDRIIGPLTELLDEHPLAEDVAAALMRGLHATGRRTEALDCYARMRQRLADELATDPGPELREIQRHILTLGDQPPAAASTTSAPPAATPGPDIGAVRPSGDAPRPPRQLPLAAAGFTGRLLELSELDSLHRAAAHTSTATSIVAITGTAGVGKTSLAVHWAHRSAGSFPDGQLHLDLHGYHPNEPVEPAAGLAAFLRALGVAPRSLPAGIDERAALFRSIVAARRMLIVLDNASSAAQIRPLLPGSRSCFVVVTSRDALGGLVARDGARRIRLDVLPPDDAVDLLHAAAGDAIGTQPAAAAQLAELCGRLPLALRLAAEIAAAQPEVGLSELLADLTDERRRLDVLDASDDQHSAIRAVFSWSYGKLEAATAAAFRLLSLHPGAALDRYAAAALTGTDLPATERALGSLTRAHLVMRPDHDRYMMHDLLRVYARELTQRQDGEADRRAALTRLFDAYRYVALRAMDVLVPAEANRRPVVPPPATPTPAVDALPAARAWLEAERHNLIAASVHAADHGWRTHAIHLPVIIWRHLYLAGYDRQALTLNARALEIAREVGDHAHEAQLLNQIAATWLHLGEPQRAIESLKRALERLSGWADPLTEARTLANLGIYHARAGQYDQAVEHLTNVGKTYADGDDPAGYAQSLANLAEVYRLQGRHAEAVSTGERAVVLYRSCDQRLGESLALNNIGLARLELGQIDAAIAQLRQALSMHREFGNRDSEGTAINGIGTAYQRRGDHASAVRHHREALAIHRGTGNKGREADVLVCLGDTTRLAGDADQARGCYEAALALSRGTGDRRDQARALDGLGRAEAAMGTLDRATAYWRQALDLYAALHLPQADDVRCRLPTSAF